MFLLCAFIYVTLSTSQRRDSELSSKLKNAETTMNNNLKSLLSVKQVTVTNNINVGAGKDFNYYSKPPTVNGYTPILVSGDELV